MASSKSQESIPLTFDLKEDALKRLAELQSKAPDMTVSQIVRYAISVFDFESYQAINEEHRQLSVRLPGETRKQLIKFSHQKKVSIGELLRAALESLPSTPPKRQTTTQTTKAMPAKKKKTTKRKTAKKATSKKKTTKKKSTTKKTAKKKAVKKTAKKKTAKKKAVKKTAKKKTTKKRTAKKTK